MATQRPLKEGSVRTYQEKVALGFPDILASEMDADLDTIYAAWNGPLPANAIGTTQLADGAVTTAKHADAPNGVTTAKINDAAITTVKVLDAAITKAKLAAGAALRQIVSLNVPAGLAKTNINTAWTDFVTLSMTTSGGLVVLIGSVGWWATGPAGSAWNVSFGWAVDQTSPNILASERTVAIPGTGNATVPFPVAMAAHNSPPGAHVYHLIVSASLASITVAASANSPGTCWAVELA
jgi:hypothetical protein